MEEIEFELDNKTILKLALLAHEKNITLNDPVSYTHLRAHETLRYRVMTREVVKKR